MAKFSKDDLENPELIKAYEFFERKKKMIFGLIVLVALLIAGKAWYSDNKAKTEIAAAEKLYSMQKEYDSQNFDKVSRDAVDLAGKYSNTNQAGDLLILAAKANIAKNKKDEAIKLLEKCAADSKKNEINFYAANYILAGLYLDGAVLKKDNSLAEKAAAAYEVAAESCDNVFFNSCTYQAARAYITAGNKAKAKSTLETLMAKDDENLGYALKDKVKTLYKTL